MPKIHRVYDDRTNETLFTSKGSSDCLAWLLEHVGENSQDFEHVWVEEVKPNATTPN